jgi:hypothetical protein
MTIATTATPDIPTPSRFVLIDMAYRSVLVDTNGSLYSYDSFDDATLNAILAQDITDRPHVVIPVDHRTENLMRSVAPWF